MRVPTLALAFLGFLLPAIPLLATPLAQTPQLTVQLLADPVPLAAGRPFTVALHFRLQPHWHLYWSNPGDSGLPPSVDWILPPGFTVGPLQFPLPTKILAPPLVSYGYLGETILLAEITPPTNWNSATPLSLKANVDWLVCQEACLPGHAELSLPLSAQPKPNPALTALFAAARLLLPAPSTPLTLTARPTAQHLDLTLSSPSARSFGKLTFFPDTSTWLDEIVPTEFQSNPDSSSLRLPLQSHAKLPESLSGVLVAENSFDSAGHRAIRLSLPLTTLSTQNSLSLPLTLLFAFLGGLILNIMPCVFPILSLKALHLLHLSGENRQAARREGLAFAAGVLLSLLTLAALLLVLRASGQALGWGFQLQSPPVVWLLLSLLLALSLNLLGLFEFPVLLSGLASRGPRQGWTGAFASGLLAVAVASPCTAPLMGAALAAAFALPPLGTLLIFTSLAFGFALPVLLLSFSPALLALLPKPGAWMNTFKKILSLPMFGAVLWLLWVALRLSGTSSAPLLLAGLLLLTLALFLYGKSQRLFPSPPVLRLTAFLFLGLSVGLPALLLKTGSSPLASSPDHLAWSEEEVARQLAAGHSVFIDFTAAWCLTCQVNQRLVLSRAEIQSALHQKKIAFLIADWTRRDPAITAALHRYGREGVPTYVLLSPLPGATPILLPELLTPALVLQALSQLP